VVSILARSCIHFGTPTDFIGWGKTGNLVANTVYVATQVVR